MPKTHHLLLKKWNERCDSKMVPNNVSGRSVYVACWLSLHNPILPQAIVTNSLVDCYNWPAPSDSISHDLNNKHCTRTIGSEVTWWPDSLAVFTGWMSTKNYHHHINLHRSFHFLHDKKQVNWGWAKTASETVPPRLIATGDIILSNDSVNESVLLPTIRKNLGYI